MGTRKWLWIGLSIASAIVAVVATELLSTDFVMYRARTEIELTALSSETGTAIVGARVVPVRSDSQQPAIDIAAAITNSDGIARFRLDLPICRGEGLISSLLVRGRLNSAYVPYDFVLEHPQFESRVLSVRDPNASWLPLEELSSELDAVLVFPRVALRPLASR